MILEFALFIWFIFSILNTTGSIRSKTTDKIPISTGTRAACLVINIILAGIFSIALYKQTIINDYPTIINTILIWFIIDCIIGSLENIKNWNAGHTVITPLSKIYAAISGVLGIFGVLFIWI